MALPLTQTPIVLDLPQEPVPSYNMNAEAGPFKAANGSWYLPEQKSDQTLGVYKRLLAASPWTEQDNGSANQPTLSNDSAWAYDPATDKIYITAPFTGGTGNNIIYTFNCATNKYETPSVPSSGTAGEGSGTQYHSLVKLSTGDIIITYEGTTGTGYIYYNRLSGGVWAGQVLLINTGIGNHLRFHKARSDNADRIHVFWGTDDAINPSLHYIQMSGAGVVGSPVLVHIFTTSGGAGLNNYGNILVDEANGIVSFISTPLASTGFTDHLPYVSSGTPLNAPVFSTVSPDPGGTTIPSNQDQGVPMKLFLNDSGNLVALWGIAGGTDPITGGYTVIQVWMGTKIAGVWGTPVLFYDAIANPPPGVVYTDGLFVPLFDINILKIPGDYVFVCGDMHSSGDFNDFMFVIAPNVGGGNYASSGGALAGPGSYASV